MKFVLISVATLALAGLIVAIEFGNQVETELIKALNLPTKPGKCPQASGLPEPFDTKAFHRTWFEIQSTHPIFEKGLRNIRVNYEYYESIETLVVTNVAVNKSDKYIITHGKPTELDNVFVVKFTELYPSAQFWIVDTDYDNYALTVSCTDVSEGSYTNDAWILSREKTLDNDIINRLKGKYTQLGFNASDLTETPQK